MLITAAILTTRVSNINTAFVEAYVAGKRVWLAFRGDALLEAQKGLFKRQDAMLASFRDLQIPNISGDTRTLLDIRLNAEQIDAKTFNILPSRVAEPA